VAFSRTQAGGRRDVQFAKTGCGVSTNLQGEAQGAVRKNWVWRFHELGQGSLAGGAVRENRDSHELAGGSPRRSSRKLGVAFSRTRAGLLGGRSSSRKPGFSRTRRGEAQSVHVHVIVYAMRTSSASGRAGPKFRVWVRGRVRARLGHGDRCERGRAMGWLCSRALHLRKKQPRPRRTARHILHPPGATLSFRLPAGKRFLPG